MINEEISYSVSEDEEFSENDFVYKYIPEPEDNIAYLLAVIFLVSVLAAVILMVLYPETAEIISEYLTEISEYDISVKTVSCLERIRNVFR